jgi:hypothetical protein
MNDKPMNYNLLEEKWIPVLGANGEPGRVGIRTALMESGHIRQIAASNPMDNVALLRLLLAVLQWCKRSLTVEERETLESAGGIPGDWLEGKLGTEDKPNLAFDLLGANGGFYQDQSAVGGRIAVTNLVHDLPSGSKIAHFRHAHDDRDGMCLACCAMALARWPGVASAGTAGGGQSMTASINGNTPTYAIPIGANLLATLRLTWPNGQAVEGDTPVWDGADELSPLGFLKGMTWRSRRVLLAPPDEGGERDLSAGRCCYCGQRTDSLVRSIVFRPGWKRPFAEPWQDDPHLLQIARQDARGAKGKEKKIVRSWPSPNEALEDHAGVWRFVLQGLLQRVVSSRTVATEFHTTLLASSQALYKHAGARTDALPVLGPDVIQHLLDEMEWLRQTTWMATSARTRKWNDPPKGHQVVDRLCASGAKGHAIRSELCARSPTAEQGLERAVEKVMTDLAVADQTDASGEARILESWRDEVRGVLCRHVETVVKATTPGSPLRRREAVQGAQEALKQALEKPASEKAPTPNVADKPNADAGSEAEHDSD